MQLISESINELIEEYSKADYGKKASGSIMKRVKHIFTDSAKHRSFLSNIGRAGRAIKMAAKYKMEPLKRVVGNTIKDSVTNFNDALHKTGSDVATDVAKVTSAVGRRVFRGTNPPDKLDKRTALGAARIASMTIGGVPGLAAAGAATQAYNFGKLSKERGTFSNLSQKMNTAKNESDIEKVTNKSGLRMPEIKDRANTIHKRDLLNKKLKDKYNII
jgi:hypothetical protein